MIQKYEVNEDALNEFRKSSEDDKVWLKAHLENCIPGFDENDVHVYKNSAYQFLFCYKGLENADYALAERGYGLTFKSISKYLKENFGKDTFGKYFITCHLQYESTLRHKDDMEGNYINLKGEDTSMDFWSTTDNIDNADIEGAFICFNVFQLKFN
jgi:hypothetical protein